MAFGAPVLPGGQETPAPVAAALLTRAVEQYLENQDHWSYTETQSVVGLSGTSKGLTILQVDPSKIYREQIKPIRVEGAPPTPSQLKDYQGRGDWEAKQRDEESEKEAKALKEAPLQNRIKLNLGGQIAVPDLGHATVIADDEHSTTYGVPFLTPEGKRSPVLDRFQVTVRINKQRGDLEHFSVRQGTSLRVRLIAKIAAYEEDAEFARVDPLYPSVMVHDVERATVSILFIKRVVTAEVKRTDLKRVQNYDERFGVKLGPISTLKF